MQPIIPIFKPFKCEVASLIRAMVCCKLNKVRPHPGQEMADADYGYVGAGRGKVSLYKRKECIEKNIPEEEAVEKLIELIKRNNDYTEK